MKKALIVGASSGIGREIAMLLANSGWKVGATGRRQHLLHSLANESSGNIVTRTIDSTASDAIPGLESLVRELGGIDLFLISAGTGDLNESLHAEIETRTVSLNIRAFTSMAVWAYHYFENQGGGQFAAITSVGGIRGNRIAPAYNASKAFQINYLEGLRARARRSSLPIHICEIRPGLVDTDMAKGEGLFWVADTRKAARQIIHALEKRKDVVYVTRRWRLIGGILKLVPRQLYARL